MDLAGVSRFDGVGGLVYSAWGGEGVDDCWQGLISLRRRRFVLNVTIRYVNGIVSSVVWTFNFTEGNTEGWIVIPANLSQGDTFFDYSKPGDVPIQSEEQKVVLGATRTVTCGSDAIRHIKEWDKATGIFINSVETIQNRTIDDWYYSVKSKSLYY
jgi:hypothetical protein